jgi:hypothetical protein
MIKGAADLEWDFYPRLMFLTSLGMQLAPYDVTDILGNVLCMIDSIEVLPRVP